MATRRGIGRLAAILILLLAVWSVAGARERSSAVLSSHPLHEAHDLHVSQDVLAGGSNTSYYDEPIDGMKLLIELKAALWVMQDRFFELWLGGWPESIDWTGAVLNAYVLAAVETFSKIAHWTYSPLPSGRHRTADLYDLNEIDTYFSHTISYYFGEDAFSLRTQAYDDIQWVVLGWLEALKFIKSHTGRIGRLDLAEDEGYMQNWHGKQFVASYAHRSHVFYDLAHNAWDPELCAGGLVWNPRLKPYKNTITNTQFIATSIAMYLHHPGDSNKYPFASSTSRKAMWGIDPVRPHEKSWLHAAENAYDWLQRVNLTNAQGLYVDGYHISNESKTNPSYGKHKQCDERSEMVYSYNQGVILTGLRGLWEGTGKVAYLQDGHDLLRNVMKATGWRGRHPGLHDPTWHGLGSKGILTDHCDLSGTCSQDAQTFKGIFFHHLGHFCQPLPTKAPAFDGSFVASKETAALHANSCKSYSRWVSWNARAALRTKNTTGVFGMWWGADLLEDPDGTRMEGMQPLADRAFDARGARSSRSGPPRTPGEADLNDRGRGRTVETQGGGLALLRCLWELAANYGQ